MNNPSGEHGSASVPLPEITARGDLDLDSLGPLTAQIEAAVATHAAVVLDAGGITFADSSFLRLVLTTHDRTDLRIANPSPAVQRLFQIVGADTFLHLYPTLEDARTT
ncbi:STAS domain-containing protein [Streptomyces sp. NBC_01335]|uniref:STAS domain-containing protein n=1 Tax=Streptomyces sp. NBC_01335 TaxID=2903828 RepID=UPI002E13C7FD|nr:STAS domain-containing protein [Streptomyces sp. NBC_01335]WSI74765.1 STAS domain-containing protein [Streptomyces sp. NBC_01335]